MGDILIEGTIMIPVRDSSVVRFITPDVVKGILDFCTDLRNKFVINGFSCVFTENAIIFTNTTFIRDRHPAIVFYDLFREHLAPLGLKLVLGYNNDWDATGECYVVDEGYDCSLDGNLVPIDCGHPIFMDTDLIEYHPLKGNRRSYVAADGKINIYHTKKDGHDIAHLMELWVRGKKDRLLLPDFGFTEETPDTLAPKNKFGKREVIKIEQRVFVMQYYLYGNRSPDIEQFYTWLEKLNMSVTIQFVDKDYIETYLEIYSGYDFNAIWYNEIKPFMVESLCVDLAL